MKLLATWALRLVTAATSVFIAACYGVPYDGSRAGGRVVRVGQSPLAESLVVRGPDVDIGIPGIEVSCLDADGVIVEQTLTNEDGDFFTHELCTALTAADIDGDANGGLFASRTVPVDSDDVRIQLELAP